MLLLLNILWPCIIIHNFSHLKIKIELLDQQVFFFKVKAEKLCGKVNFNCVFIQKLRISICSFFFLWLSLSIIYFCYHIFKVRKVIIEKLFYFSPFCFRKNDKFLFSPLLDESNRARSRLKLFYFELTSFQTFAERNCKADKTCYK